MGYYVTYRSAVSDPRPIQEHNKQTPLGRRQGDTEFDNTYTIKDTKAHAIRSTDGSWHCGWLWWGSDHNSVSAITAKTPYKLF
jgi:hypothetical protein